jgi:hypothetical protein
MMPRTGVAMTIPHYINEDRSEMRGIKPGWYAMEDDGKLYSGPFSSRRECPSTDTQESNGSIPPKVHKRPN